MANDVINISIPLKFDVKSPPLGMTDYDPKALSPDQQRELNMYKLKLRKENIRYLTEHPERLNRRIKSCVKEREWLEELEHLVNCKNEKGFWWRTPGAYQRKGRAMGDFSAEEWVGHFKKLFRAEDFKDAAKKENEEEVA